MTAHARIGWVATRPRYLLVLVLVGAVLIVVAVPGVKDGTLSGPERPAEAS
jgi:hypothetical protein